MKIQITTPIWLSIKSETRQELAKIFSLSKSTYTNIVDGRVMCDGFSNEDLTFLTLEKLKDFTGCASDELVTQFECAVKKIENPESVKYETVPEVESVMTTASTTDELKMSGVGVTTSDGEITNLTNTKNETKENKQNKGTNRGRPKKNTKTK